VRDQATGESQKVRTQKREETTTMVSLSALRRKLLTPYLASRRKPTRPFRRRRKRDGRGRGGDGATRKIWECDRGETIKKKNSSEERLYSLSRCQKGKTGGGPQKRRRNS